MSTDTEYKGGPLPEPDGDFYSWRGPYRVQSKAGYSAETVLRLLATERERCAIPGPGSPEASAMIDSVLAEYGWPANAKNAARAGYVAAQRLMTPAVRALAEPAAEIQRIRENLGCVGAESDTDPIDVINMLRSWEADAESHAELLEKHLSNVLEVARTWQPDYATKMDRDTLAHAEDCLRPAGAAAPPAVKG